MITEFQIFENLTDSGILPPKIKQKNSNGGKYLYYAIFEEMFIPKKMIRLISPVEKGAGIYLLTEIFKGNPYKSGINEFLIFPTYVNSNINIDDKKYDKIIFNNHIRTPFKMTEEKIDELHKKLILNLLDKYNDNNVDLKNVIKFKDFSAFLMKDIDDNWWNDILDGINNDDESRQFFEKHIRY